MLAICYILVASVATVLFGTYFLQPGLKAGTPMFFFTSGGTWFLLFAVFLIHESRINMRHAQEKLRQQGRQQ